MQSAEVRTAREAARLAARREAVRGSKESGSLSSFASEESAAGKRPGQSRNVGRGSETRFEKLEGDGSAKAGCHEPDIGLGSVRRREVSSDPDSPGGAANEHQWCSCDFQQ